MGAYSPIKIKYNPQTTYPGTTQNNIVGATTLTGKRTMPASFPDSISFSVSKAGNDNNPGTIASPKLTIGSLFATTSNATFDSSVNGYNATLFGAVPVSQWPNLPAAMINNSQGPIVPPIGVTVAGPFSDSNYMMANANVAAALNGKTTFTLEGAIFPTANTGTNDGIFMQSANGTGVEQWGLALIANTTALRFDINGVFAITPNLPIGQWTYWAATYDGTTMLVYTGSSPETATIAATNTVSFTPTVTAIWLGRGVSNGYSGPNAYHCRWAFSSVTRTVFPVYSNAGNKLLAIYRFDTASLVQGTGQYIVVRDSGIYNENLYANWKYDVYLLQGIYADVGQAPTVQYQKGAVLGTYGSNSNLRVAPGATSKYVSASTGSDSNSGTSTSPYATLTKAFSSILGGTITIMDSGTYTSNYNVPNYFYSIQAAAGQTPIFAAGGAGQHFNYTGTSSSLAFSGCSFAGNGYGGALFGATSAIGIFGLELTYCTISNYGLLCNSTPTSIGLTQLIGVGLYNVINIQTANIMTAFTASNCYLENSASSLLSSSRANGIFTSLLNSTLKNCTFINFNFMGSSNSVLSGCLFKGGYVMLTFGTNIVSDCVFSSSGLVLAAPNGEVGSNYIKNCLFLCLGSVIPASFGTIYYTAAINFRSDAGTLNALVENCLSSGYSFGYTDANVTWGTGQVKLRNCSSLAATSAGFNAPHIGGGMILTFCIDSGSAAATAGTPAIISLESSAAVVSNSIFTPNGVLLPTDPAFAGGLNGVSWGYNSQLWFIAAENGTGAGNLPLALNGFIFNGASYPTIGEPSSTNQEGGLILGGGSWDVENCSFLNLGGGGATILSTGPVPTKIFSNYFSTFASGIQIMVSGVLVSNNIGFECSSAFIVSAVSGSTIEFNSVWGCAWGQFDLAGGLATALISNIYAGSSTYDYSGNSIQTYSCIGTIDPATAGSVDIHSTRLDPLFRDTLTGDLRLQALAVGSSFNSPAVGTGSGGADMGAFEFTYGAASTSWTTIDFSTTDSVGPATGPYRNPDTLGRAAMAIHSSEVNQEDGSVFTVSSTTKLELTLGWIPTTNDMPTAQILALQDMYILASANNAIQIDFGDVFSIPGVPIGYNNAYLLRAPGFDYEEVTSAYSDDTVPTPLRQLVLRLA